MRFAATLWLCLSLGTDSTRLVSISSRYLPPRSAKRFNHPQSLDCLIATIAIENGVPVWHHDRDFEAIARYANLEVRGHYTRRA
jgi:hypothetical protein